MKQALKKGYMIKNTLLAVGLAVGIASSALAASVTTVVTCNNNSFTNVPTALGGGFTLTSAQVTSPSGFACTIQLFDTASGLRQTNAAYSTVGSYVTNYITTWTNYYGYTNNVTNLALVDYSNYVAAVTNNLTPDYVWSVPTNSTVTFTVNNRFVNGLGITNTTGVTGANATISLTYVQ